MGTTGEVNGSGGANGAAGAIGVVGRAPERIIELASACVRFVERATGVRLDFEPETLSVLDHYLASARRDIEARPEARALIAHAAGAYFGEVVRRRHASWWRVDGDDPGLWRVELEEVYLAFSPVLLAADALGAGVEEIEYGGLEVGEEDRDAVRSRLAELPEVSEEEYVAPTTRLEVIDIVVEAIRARRIAEDEPPSASLGPADYDD